MSKIERAFQLYEHREANKMTVPKIAAKLGISTRTVRGYIYRMRYPDEYKACVQRYFTKRRILAAAAEKQQLAGKAIKRNPAFVLQKPLVQKSEVSEKIRARAAKAAAENASEVKRLQAKTMAIVKGAKAKKAAKK